MYFSRIRLRTDANSGALARQLCEKNSYREHQMLWRLFDNDPDAKRDFLFRRDDLSGWPLFYLVSRRIPEAQDNIWQIDQQDYQPQLHGGQKLAFSLRANPVITRKDASGKPKRHDLVMDLKRQKCLKSTRNKEREPLYQLTQQAGEKWLSPRLQHNGAKLESLSAEGYVQHTTHKDKHSRPIRYSTLDFSGTLTVSDPEVFINTLYRGLGPAKAFGCGLLLIRRL